MHCALHMNSHAAKRIQRSQISELTAGNGFFHALQSKKHANMHGHEKNIAWPPGQMMVTILQQPWAQTKTRKSLSRTVTWWRALLFRLGGYFSQLVALLQKLRQGRHCSAHEKKHVLSHGNHLSTRPST